ncbi:MAG: sulfatase-like hydrolase/transferase [Acidobacteriota bacterium]
MNAKAAPLLGVLLVLLVAADASPLLPRHRFHRSGSAGARYNVVFILTDDQRWDTADLTVDGQEIMPNVRAEMIEKGVQFTNAFVSTPLCCPDRASLLAGGYYAHNTGVLTNEGPNGGVEKFLEQIALPVRVRQAGYRTGLIGKYLNRYQASSAYVPPGWSYFAAIRRSKSWFDYEMVIGRGAVDGPGEGRVEDQSDYLTDRLTELAVEFIESGGDSPFFLYFTPVAPHEPATPAPGDETLYPEFIYSGRGTGESDLRDKPAWVRELAARYDATQQAAFARDQLRSLRSVDRSVAALVEAVRRKQMLDRTIFIYTSDNGYLWGEHGLSGKAYPYEESLRVPLIVRMPGVSPRREEKTVVTNVDIGATIHEAAGLNNVTDGASLLPLLADSSTEWRTEFLIQGHGGLRWSGIRAEMKGRTWKYVEHATGEKELYDLNSDPFEMKSRHNEQGKSMREIRATLAKKLAAMRGLNIVSRLIPGVEAGAPYAFSIATWGGRPPFRWAVSDGELPAGLGIDAALGTISGTPEVPGMYSFRVRVEDSSVSPFSGRPQAYEQDFVIAVRQPGEKVSGPQTYQAADTSGDQR